MSLIFKLGEILQDSISGFNGICIARAEYRYGENSYLLTQENEGAVKEEWIVESRLFKLVKNAYKRKKRIINLKGAGVDAALIKKVVGQNIRASITQKSKGRKAHSRPSKNLDHG